MARNIRADIVIGTRPEAIKTAPVINEMRSRPNFDVRVIATGQHTEMLTQALSHFGISPDIDLEIMREAQTLDHITASVLARTGAVLDGDRPDVVLVHGDTSTAMAASLAAFYRKIPVGHIEAGLRSGDIYRPFPEEINRVFVDRIAAYLFAPTDAARDNLIAEGRGEDDIYITGNTVIDALYQTAGRAQGPKERSLRRFEDGRPFILLTAHRRESWGEALENICRASVRIMRSHGIDMLIPMHKNPKVREVMLRYFDKEEGAVLCEPLDYPDFVWAIGHCRLIMSDSGGVQEEATAMSRPVVILRDVTERPEAVSLGSGVLAGTDEERVYGETDHLLADQDAYQNLVDRCKAAPFGDGHAAMRIADILSAKIGAAE